LCDHDQPRRFCDPRGGTGGFLLAAHDYIVKHNPTLDRAQKKHLKLDALRGVDIVDSVVRLCAMNLLLRDRTLRDRVRPTRIDRRRAPRRPRRQIRPCVDEPTVGKKSSVMVVNAEGESEREALTVVRDELLGLDQ